jgi:hypothetical protein
MANPPSKAGQASGKFYAVNCDCGFTAKSHNQGELEEITGIHGKRSHPDMKLGANEIRQMVKAV